MKEETGVNFLPEEQRKNKPKQRPQKAAIAYSSPKKEELAKKEQNQSKGNFWNIFKFRKKSKQEDNFEQAVPNLAKTSKAKLKQSEIKGAREELLKKIKEKSTPKNESRQNGKQAGFKKDDLNFSSSKEKKPKFNFFADWLKTRKAKKEEKRKNKQIAKLKKKQEKEAELKKKREQKEQKRQAEKKQQERIKQEKRLKQKQESRELDLSDASNPKENDKKENKASSQPKSLGADKNLLITNLIKSQEFFFFNWRRAITINITVIAISLLAVGGVWGYLAWVIGEKQVVDSKLASDLSAKKQELLQSQKDIDETERLRLKAKEVKNILDKHIYWSNFFAYLESKTLSDIRYFKFVGDLEGEYVLPGIAGGFNDYIAQMKNWQKSSQEDFQHLISAYSPGFESARESANSSGQDIGFELELKMNPQIFFKD